MWVSSRRSWSTTSGSAPRSCARSIRESAAAVSPAISASIRSSTRPRSARPSMSRTDSAVTAPPPSVPPRAMAWSSSERPSRTLPSAARAIMESASGSAPHTLLGGDGGEVGAELGLRHALQVEGLAARQDGGRHLAQLGGGEEELHRGRRLLQGLQQGVEGLGREHVHLVQDGDPEARLGGAVADGLAQLAHVVDAVVAGGVHLHHVRVAVGEDGAAFRANAAGLGRRAAGAVGADAVQGAGDDAGGGGLADAAHAGEHEGVGDAALGEGVAEGADQRVLADQLGEGGGAVFAGEHAIGRAGGGRRRRVRGRGRGGGCVAFTAAEQARAFGGGRLGQAFVPRLVVFRGVSGAEQGADHARATDLEAVGVEDRRSDPGGNSLRLLPSGPDRVGEAPVRHRPSIRTYHAWAGGTQGGAGGRRRRFAGARFDGLAAVPGVFGQTAKGSARADRCHGLRAGVLRVFEQTAGVGQAVGRCLAASLRRPAHGFGQIAGLVQACGGRLTASRWGDARVWTNGGGRKGRRVDALRPCGR